MLRLAIDLRWERKPNCFAIIAKNYFRLSTKFRTTVSEISLRTNFTLKELKPFSLPSNAAVNRFSLNDPIHSAETGIFSSKVELAARNDKKFIKTLDWLSRNDFLREVFRAKRISVPRLIKIRGGLFVRRLRKIISLKLSLSGRLSHPKQIVLRNRLKSLRDKAARLVNCPWLLKGSAAPPTVFYDAPTNKARRWSSTIELHHSREPARRAHTSIPLFTLETLFVGCAIPPEPPPVSRLELMTVIESQIYSRLVLNSPLRHESSDGNFTFARLNSWD